MLLEVAKLLCYQDARLSAFLLGGAPFNLVYQKCVENRDLADTDLTTLNQMVTLFITWKNYFCDSKFYRLLIDLIGLTPLSYSNSLLENFARLGCE